MSTVLIQALTAMSAASRQTNRLARKVATKAVSNIEVGKQHRNQGHQQTRKQGRTGKVASKQGCKHGHRQARNYYKEKTQTKQARKLVSNKLSLKRTTTTNQARKTSKDPKRHKRVQATSSVPARKQHNQPTHPAQSQASSSNSPTWMNASNEHTS